MKGIFNVEVQEGTSSVGLSQKQAEERPFSLKTPTL
jgi:hypothetical protein